MEFVDLHLHSCYSFLDGFGRIEPIVDRAVELGRKAIALTDHDSVMGFPDLGRKCKMVGIKPIYGCEVRTVKSIQKMKDEGIRTKKHLILLVKNQKGYSNLMRLVTAAWNDGFYYKPTIDGAVLKKYHEKLICLSGCLASSISGLLLDNQYDNALLMAKKFKNLFGDDYYLEFQPLEYDENRKIALGMEQIHKVAGIPVVVTCDVHYMKQGQEKYWRILNCIKRRLKWADSHEMSKFCYQQTIEELAKNMKHNLQIEKQTAIDAVKSTTEIAEKCNAELARLSPPSFDYDGDKVGYFKKLCQEGMKKKGFDKNNEYLERLKRETDLIIKKGYVDYFLIVADTIRFARSKDILTAITARGSAAGSLACYFLGITNVDPIKFNLMFERFISEDRMDLPDIDTDYEDVRRNEVIEYLVNKYGADRVVGIATSAEFKGRNTLDEMGRVFSIPRAEIDVIKKVIIEREDTDSRASLTIRDTLDSFEHIKPIIKKYPEIENAAFFEGQYRHMGEHAAGIVMAEKPLEGTVAIYQKNGQRLLGFDMWRAERLGMMKMDILGVKSLNIIKRITDRVDLKDLYSVPLDDEKTIKAFADKDVQGIFQFQGDVTASLVDQMTETGNPVAEFNDLVVLNALSRPGPLHGGGTQYYMKVRKEGTKKEWNNKIMDRVTEKTKGIVMFQEQVMQTAREIGLLNWEDTTAIRSAMGKSKGIGAFDVYREKFFKGARKNNLTEELMQDIWNHICTFGSWGFNLSHAVSYALFAYYMMYLKVHYPLEFYWASLSRVDDDSVKEKKFVKEAMDKGIKILPPKIPQSEGNWTIENDCLRVGLKSLKGIGDKTSKEIPKAKAGTLDELISKIPKRILNIRVIKAIEKYRLFDKVDIDVFGIKDFTKALEGISGVTKVKELVYAFNKKENVVLAGRIYARNLKTMSEINTKIPGIGIIKRESNDPSLEEWVVMRLEDDTGSVQLFISHILYPKYKEMIWTVTGSDIIIAKGTIPAHRKFMRVHELSVLEKESKHAGAKCDDCPLKERPFVPSKEGLFSFIFAIGEAPGFNEAKQGEPFVGKAGIELRKILEELDVDIEEVVLANVVGCHPVDENDKNRTPELEEIECCVGRLRKEIISVKPKCVLLLGNTALHALTDVEGNITAERSRILTVEGIPAIATFHPSYILHAGQEQKEKIKNSIKDDILKLLKEVKLK